MRKNICSVTVLSLCVASLSTILLMQAKNKRIAYSNGCEHDGNHYTQLKSDIFTAGTKEYWVCCKCHEHFFEEPEGVWIDKGQAGKVSGTDDRVINPVFKRSGIVTGETITDGYKFDGMIDPTKQYVYKTESMLLNNMSFTLKCDNLTTNFEECVGFYLHTHSSPAPLNKTNRPLVFSLWSGVGYGNEIFGYLSNDELIETESIAVADLEASKKGFSVDEGPLSLVCVEDLIDLTFNFSVMENGFLKMEIKSNNINAFVRHNAYNVNAANDTVFTYIKPMSLGGKDLSSTGYHLCLFGKRFTIVENSNTISLTNIVPGSN